MKTPNVTSGEWVAVHGVGVSSKANRTRYEAREFNASSCDICVTLNKINPAEEEANGRMLAASKSMAAALEEVNDLLAISVDILLMAGVHPDRINKACDMVRDSLLEAGYIEDQ